MSSVIIFSYSFPHRKTNDFILDITLKSSLKPIVIAAPYRALKTTDMREYFEKRLLRVNLYETKILCHRLGVEYHEVAHNDFQKISRIVAYSHVQLAIISGARILDENIIQLFSQGVINMHPGRLPETSGLDSFFYTLKKGIPAGVTAHFIDKRIDAGRLIGYRDLELKNSDSIEIVLENLYSLQRIFLLDLLNDKAYKNSGTLIDRPNINSPLLPSEKKEIIESFDIWKRNLLI